MQFRNIEIFLELVRTRNITKTAQQMHLSQSTISNRLKALEEELGYEVIVRAKGRRTIQLTRQGELFIPVAERWRYLFEETELLKKQAIQTLRIATNESAYYELLNFFIIHLMKRYPTFKFSVQICDSAYTYDLVENNLVDYGFASYESSRNEVVSKSIYKQKYCIICYSPNPMPVLMIDPKDLDPEKEVNYTGGNFSTFKAWHEKWFGVHSACRIEINSCRAAIPYLKELGYWALCPPTVAKTLAQELSLQVYQIDDPPEDREIYFLKRKDSSLKSMEIGRVFEQELDEYIVQCKM